jgi:putative acetyltransferase
VSNDVEVRPTLPGDKDAILGVVREAFATGGRDGQEELDIVEGVWALDAAGADLDLVALRDGMVCGHVLGSWGDLGERQVIGIAPLAVSPAYQRTGIGNALMRQIIQRADDVALPLVVLLGDPEYYGRFGFEPAALLDIWYRPVGRDSPHFQVRRLGAYGPGYRGEYRYAWEMRPPR